MPFFIGWQCIHPFHFILWHINFIVLVNFIISIMFHFICTSHQHQIDAFIREQRRRCFRYHRIAQLSHYSNFGKNTAIECKSMRMKLIHYYYMSSLRQLAVVSVVKKKTNSRHFICISIEIQISPKNFHSTIFFLDVCLLFVRAGNAPDA